MVTEVKSEKLKEQLQYSWLLEAVRKLLRKLPWRIQLNQVWLTFGPRFSENVGFFFCNFFVFCDWPKWLMQIVSRFTPTD